MASILYLPGHNGMGTRFNASVMNEICENGAEMCRTFEELSQRLRKPNVRVAVLFAMEQEALSQLLSLADLMTDVKSILVLADQDKDTMSKAHKLRPRYITWTDCGLNDLVAVFLKMIELYDIHPARGRGSRVEQKR